MVSQFKMAVLLLFVHPVLDQSLLQSHPAHTNMLAPCPTT